MMHTKILEKCLEELRKDTPRKDYVIGMLETLVEMDGGQLVTKPGAVAVPVEILPIPDFPVVGKVDEIITDEDKEFARKMTNGPVANLKG